MSEKQVCLHVPRSMLHDDHRLYAERHVTKPENRSPDFRLSENPVAVVGTDSDSYWLGLANL